MHSPENIEDTSQTPRDRLTYTGNLAPVLDHVADEYQISDIIQFSVFDVGYEDCNVRIDTKAGSYVAKIFSKVRTREDIARYTTIMQKALEAGVQLGREGLMKELA